MVMNSTKHAMCWNLTISLYPNPMKISYNVEKNNNNKKTKCKNEMYKNDRFARVQEKFCEQEYFI